MRVNIITIGDIDTIKEEFTCELALTVKWKEPTIKGMDRDVRYTPENRKYVLSREQLLVGIIFYVLKNRSEYRWGVKMKLLKTILQDYMYHLRFQKVKT